MKATRIVAGLAFVMGCGAEDKDSATSCTEIGCVNGFSMVVTDSFGEAATGVYGSFDIISGDSSEMRSYTFDCATGEGDASCDGNIVTIELDDAADLPSDAMYLYSVSISVAESASGTGTFNWNESSPNGAECPPTCYTMEVEVGLQLSEPAGG
jgi:hypothetical protein